MAKEPNGRRGEKSASAYRTISEVAEEIDVPAHVLRFWEGKFPSVNPLKRGGGRRYYRPEDIEGLRRIRKLLYEDGFTIRGVQKLLKSNGGKPPAAVATAAEVGGEMVTTQQSEPAPKPKTDPGQGMLEFGLSANQAARLRKVLKDLQAMRDALSKAAA